MLFKDSVELLSANTAVDDGVGVEVQKGSKVLGYWPETFGPFAAATATTESVFIAPFALELVGFQIVFGTASSSGTITIEKLTGTTAPGGGTALLTGTVSTAGTANTVLKGTLIGAPGSLQLAAGDRLGLVFAGTATGLVGLQVEALLKKI